MFLVDSPFARVDISFTATVWSPKVGSKLRGKINICSPDHIGLLVHQTFNASIPRHHIPSHEWEFEYGALENDPEYGWGATGDGEEEARGRWVHKVSGEVIGSDGRPIEFTIIGLNISHSMLSLIGSIQPDPFSPEHKPLPAMSHASPAKRGSRSMRSISEEASVHNALTQDDLEAYETEAMDGDEAMERDMEGGPSVDEREVKRQAELEKQEKREKKRKRREERKSQKTGQDGDMTGERKRKKKKKDDE
ncbi:hypothetical protein CPB86DRAFT_870349 [Serendipita vermifera]|nr:hypothetical protein CPB86DRAFT_870349 [Serendipita vermifera]